MIIHNTPGQVYKVLTNLDDLSVWIGAPVVGRVETGAVIEMRFQQRTMGSWSAKVRLDFFLYRFSTAGIQCPKASA